MSKLGLLFWLGVFFLWIIYLRMKKEEDSAALREENESHNKSKM